MTNLKFVSRITDSWPGGYKLVFDIEALSHAEVWKLYFKTPHTIRASYGVSLEKASTDSYIIGGLDDQVNLCPGDKIMVVFIIDSFDEPIRAVLFDTPIVEASLSDKAIACSFENHGDEATYDRDAQSKDWKVEFSTHLDKYARISTQAPHSGTKSLRLRYPSTEQANNGASWVIPDLNEYYLSYWVLFAQDFQFNGKFDWSSGGKLPGLGSKGLCSGGNTCDGNNGFSSRFMWRENGAAVVYLYHMDKAGKYGDDLALIGKDGKEKYFIKGQWHNLIQRVKINDQSYSNGSLDVWLDKEHVLNKKDIRLVSNKDGVNRMYFSTFHGGYGENWWPKNDVYAYFDDFVISPNKSDMPW